METITVTWELGHADPRRVMFYVDGAPVGEDDIGFDKILAAVRSHKNIQLTLKIPGMTSLGGESLTGSLPFSDRFEELEKALGDNELIFEFS